MYQKYIKIYEKIKVVGLVRGFATLGGERPKTQGGIPRGLKLSGGSVPCGSKPLAVPFWLCSCLRSSKIRPRHPQNSSMTTHTRTSLPLSRLYALYGPQSFWNFLGELLGALWNSLEGSRVPLGRLLRAVGGLLGFFRGPPVASWVLISAA